MAGNAARLAAARSHVRVDRVATGCAWRAAIPRFPELLAAHAKTAELASG
jgi:transposase